MRLRWRLFLVALLLTLPLLALVPWLVFELRKADADEAHQDAQRLASTLAREHEAMVESARQLLASLAHVPQVLSGDAGQCARIFAAILGERPMFAVFEFADLVERGVPIEPAQHRLLRRDGSEVAVYSSYVLQPNARGEPEVFRVDLDLDVPGLAARLRSV